MPTFSWNPNGGYYYPDPNGSATFASGAEAGAAPAPAGAAAPASPTASGTPTQTMTDPSTGRPIYTGPQGEGGSATPIPGGTSWTQPNGVTVYYVPGQDIQAGNQAALGLGVTSTQLSPGGSSDWLAAQQNAATQAAATTAQQQQQAAQTAATNAQNQQSALGILQNELTSWGFGADAIAWAQGAIASNQSVDQMLYELRQQPFYQNSIFGQTNKARTAAGLPVLTEAQILGYKDTAMQIARSAGLPQGFMTDSELTQLMGADVSTTELDQRVTNGYVKALQAPPEVKQALSDYYGLSTGGLAAYYLDPNKALPLLEKQLTSAQIGGASIRTGYGEVGQTTAEGLAAQGVTETGAQTGFGHLATLSPLFNPLPGESGATPITQAEQLGSEFANNAQDQLLIKQASDTRKAVFQGGGRYDESTKGLGGLGNAPVV